MEPERLDSERIFQHFGVHRLPRPLPPAPNLYPGEYLGTGRSARVLVSIDLSDEGVVERVEVVPLPPPREQVRVRAILVHANGEQEAREGERTLDPLFVRAAEESAREMRFSPAELDGKPVPLKGMRMTFWFSDPESAR